jgi:hypothetical protein
MLVAVGTIRWLVAQWPETLQELDAEGRLPLHLAAASDPALIPVLPLFWLFVGVVRSSYCCRSGRARVLPRHSKSSTCGRGFDGIGGSRTRWVAEYNRPALATARGRAQGHSARVIDRSSHSALDPMRTASLHKLYSAQHTFSLFN